MDVDPALSLDGPSETELDFSSLSDIMISSPFSPPETDSAAAHLPWASHDNAGSLDLGIPIERLQLSESDLDHDAFLNFLIDPNLDRDNQEPPPVPFSTSPPLQPCPPANQSTTRKPFVCDTCGKRFATKGKLDKHINNHTKRRRCPVAGCRDGGAENKDLYRHLWSKHEAYAREHNIRRERDKCDVCGYQGRRDNVKRHKRLKHPERV